MTRRTRATLTAVAAALSVGLVGVADAATYRGAVGPGQTIKLTKANGAAARSIPAGRHTFVIRDRSSVHDFVLRRGTTIIRRTGIGATGTFTWRRVRILRRTHTFYCSTHSRAMRGSFRVL
jgi:hypothetical protein